MKKLPSYLFLMLFALVLASCGGGGGSGATSSSNTSNPQAAATQFVDKYTAITTGDPAEFSTTTTIASIYKSLLATIRQWSPIGTVYAASNCSVLSTSRTIMVAKSNGELTSFSVTNEAKSDTLLTINGNEECVTSVQDSSDYISFLSDNILDSYGKCDILFLRKKDAFVYCLKASIGNLIAGANNNTQVSYSIGAKTTSTSSSDYRANYDSNSSGYKAVVTRNGKYLFTQFSTTVNNKNYVGVSRFTLNPSSKPSEKILWLKEITTNNNIDSYTLRGFIGLESGDAIIDYIDDTTISSSNSFPNRPLDAAIRKYIAVSETISDPNLQPSITIFKGKYGYLDWPPEGDLLTYLSTNDPTHATDSSGNPTASYSQNINGGLISITSDPNNNDRVFYATMTPTNYSRVGPMVDLFKITITSNGTTANISNIEYIGGTTSYYPFVVLGNKIYSYARSSSYTILGGGTQSTQNAIISFSLTNIPNSQREVYPAGATFTYSVFPSKNSMFVLEGFNGYFGGMTQGNNKIYQLDVSGTTETVTDIDLGNVSAGTYSLKALSINHVTNQVQMSGEKKDVMFGPTTKQWFGFADATGMKNLSLVSSLSAINYDSPVISLRYSNGLKPTFSN